MAALWQRRSSVLRYELQEVVATGKEIGRGSYAVVEELNFRGLSCVGKSIHLELYRHGSDQERVDMLERFEGECDLLSLLHHPNIVQFLGVHFTRNSPIPILVMERMNSTLSDCIDTYGRLPAESCYSILHDVAVGLSYLHSYLPNPIIHRDLTANNVLLTSDLNAKISDLGMARILNLSPARMSKMTKCPGAPSYMPPEALVARPIYSTKLDIFSYGNLMVHVFCGTWPIPDEVFRVDPNDANVMTPLTEIDRREQYLNDVGSSHPLIGLMRQCLSNSPVGRPDVPEILASISNIMPQYPPTFQNRVEAVQQIRIDADEKDALNDRVTNLVSQVEQKDGIIESLSAEIADANTQVRSKITALEAKDTVIASLKVQLDGKIAALASKDAVITSLTSEARTMSQKIQDLTDDNAALSMTPSPNEQKTQKRLILEDRSMLLFVASKEGRAEAVEFLLNLGADPNYQNENGSTPLSIAAEKGHAEVIKKLLKAGANTQLQPQVGETALYYAARKGYSKIVILLVEANADVDQQNKDGSTSLFIASQNGHVHVVEALLSKGADSNIQKKDGTSPIYIASQNNHQQVVQLLLDNGADINLQRETGATPLYIAAENGHRTTAELLINKGADINLPTKDGTSPIYIASQNNHQQVVQLLLDNGADINLQREEDTVSNHHIWQDTDTREACYLSETQYCQDGKLLHPKRSKVRCSACRVLVHTTCRIQLHYEGINCKETFREIKQKEKETVVLHHFLHRRKTSGKCKKCEKGFGNWKKFTGREVIAISCSYCGDSYHPPCYNSTQLRQEPCHMGPLRNLIIPPSWIVRVPAVERMNSQGSEDSPKASARRKSRRTRRRKPDDRASKFFTVKPVFHRHHKPLLVFINPKSGGNQGAKLMQIFQWLLNPRQVFDLSQGGPMFGLKLYKNLSNLRILACGGDGTVGWVLSILDKLDIWPLPPVAVLPLGTRNDLARMLGWGGGYSDEPLDKILMHVEDGPVVKMDRWHLTVWPNPNAHDLEGVDDVPLHVINNYFSIGADAHVALEFHLGREANPETFNNRMRNKYFYVKMGGKDLVTRRYANLTDYIRLFGDGEDLTQKIRQLRLEAICFLNITSYGAGTNPWGTPSSRDQKFSSQSINDGKIEIVGFWASTFPKLRVGIAHGERIAQCMCIKLITERSLPVQIDGEACKLQSSIMEVGIKDQAMMIKKVPRSHSEAFLHGVRPSDQIKLSVSKVTSEQYEKMHSDLNEIRRVAQPLGLVVATAPDTMKTVRPQIDRYTEEPEYGRRKLAPNWRFLDVATSGRVDRMFQVLPDQEDSIHMGDMLSDGLLVVEPESSPSGSPQPKTSGFLSPVDENVHPLTALGSPAERRRSLGKSVSYRLATDVLPVVHTPLEERSSLLEARPFSHEDSFSGSPRSPLSIFQEEDEIDIVASAGVVNEPGPSSIRKTLMDAVKRGNLEKLKECHEKGAKLTTTDANGWTPLHHAARLDRKEIVRYLVDNLPKEALDIVEDEKLQTALHKAAWYGYGTICRTLVEKGASLTRSDYQGNTPYLKSLQCGDADVQQYLRRTELQQRNRVEEEEGV